MSEQNVEVVRRLQDAFNRRDRAALARVLGPDLEFIPMLARLEGRVYHGPDELLEWVDALEEDWEEFELCPEQYFDLGDRVLCLGHWRARARTSGVELDGQPGAWLVDVRDGLITRSETFTHRADALDAAGVSEEDLPAPS
jgi:ketosteroid isomerase-like protein